MVELGFLVVILLALCSLLIKITVDLWEILDTTSEEIDRLVALKNGSEKELAYKTGNYRL